MSKIGKINITIPEKVKVVLAGNMLNIEGPLGKKSIGIDLDMFNLDIKEGKEILDNSGLKLISAENLNDAAQKIVEAIK